MGGPPGSQVAPLPTNLPFRLVSKTIGSGAYASIRKAVPHNAPGPVIAVKFVNKEHAFRAGRLRPKQLHIELSLHKSVCPHQNIIRYLSHGEDASWIYMCMELAEGGDLFDKIEADEGVGEDVAHFYFTQLVSAIAWCHGKGVAHRDIKPENMLLSGEGDLKLADFGLATQFIVPRTGERKLCGMVCGSPPYIAPEILDVGLKNCKRKPGEDKAGYDPHIADIWSCAIVLFVLLAGNTPWDSPVQGESYEFDDYVTSHGRPQHDDDNLWAKVPAEALSLLRGMLRVDATERFTLAGVRAHPWSTRPNPHLNAKGRAADSVSLATQMIEALHIDFSGDGASSRRQRQASRDPDAMDVDDSSNNSQPLSLPAWSKFASTQPETPTSAELPFDNDWEAPPRLGHPQLSSLASHHHHPLSASQPTTHSDLQHLSAGAHALLRDHLSLDPAMSQFSATPSVPLSLTQAARCFADIVPPHSLARFISALPISQLLPMLLAALHRLNIPVAAPPAVNAGERVGVLSIRIKTLDARRQVLQGHVVIEERGDVLGGGQQTGGVQVLEVRFAKSKGDPVGWRRLFKQVAVLCKEGVVVPL